MKPSFKSLLSRVDSSVLFLLAGLAASLTLGYFTYFRNYQLPAALFWDENYHIAAAQKYLHGVFFMEPHPPLGKLLIALGEKLVAPNAYTDQFLSTDHATNIPPGFSFAGYRFFPALFAWLASGVLFLLFLEVTGNSIKAFLYTCPYLFDNALIVHTRGAMLEGPQLFFIILFLLFFLRWLNESGGRIDSILLGVAMGAALSIKINSAFIVVLPLIGWWLQSRGVKKTLIEIALMYGAALLVICCVWTTHFHIARRVEASLPNAGFYNASESYKDDLRRGGQINFFTALSDNLEFAKQYTAGVPKLNPCKQGENGSHPIFWPLGGGAILYRWDSSNEVVRYLYLQSNPVGWMLALLAVIVITASVISATFFGSVANMRKAHPFAMSLLAGYWGYMATVLCVDRVLYLYHYFMPLVLGYALLPFAVESIQRIGKIRIRAVHRWIALGASVIFLIECFVFFKPFTYYEPLSSNEFKYRQILSLWRLTCVNCKES